MTPAGKRTLGDVAPVEKKPHHAHMAPRVALTASLVILAVLATPSAARAQPSGKAVRIGYLSPLTAKGDAAHRQAFLESLRALGYVEGRNVVLETRYADGRFERLPDLAAELARVQVDVIVAAPTPGVRAAQQATRTIPIVMAFSGDPVGDKFVAALARPGGNITGLSAAAGEMTAKRVEFLKAISRWSSPRSSSWSSISGPRGPSASRSRRRCWRGRTRSSSRDEA